MVRKMQKFCALSDEKKTAFFIGLSEKCITLLTDDSQIQTANNALERCWEWLINAKHDGAYLYELLDNEENGVTIFLEMTDDTVRSAIWNCLTDTVAFTSRQAYDKENAKFYPEPIKLVDDGLAEHLLTCFNVCFSGDEYAEKLLDFLLSAKAEELSHWRDMISKIENANDRT